MPSLGGLQMERPEEEQKAEGKLSWRRGGVVLPAKDGDAEDRGENQKDPRERNVLTLLETICFFRRAKLPL